MENVTVNNLGIDLLKWSPFLQKGTSFQEVLKITLSKNSRFFAKNRVFTANKTYIVPENYVLSIDGEQEHSAIAKIALQDAQIAQSRFRLITNPAIEVMTKLADRAYDLVIFRDNAEDLHDAIVEAHRILRSGGVFVIDNFFGGAKVNDPAMRDPKTIALRDAGKLLKGETEKWVTSLIPLGDGLLLATKL